MLEGIKGSPAPTITIPKAPVISSEPLKVPVDNRATAAAAAKV